MSIYPNDKKSSQQIILYPKPIPPLDKRTLPNENGFTLTEIAALQNGWRLIKRRLNHHSRKLFMEFFQEYDPLLERFRDITGKFNMARLHQHPQLILQVYGNLIEHGLNDAAYINVLMAEVSQRHKLYGVTYEEIKLHTDHILLYILEYLEKIISATFIGGLMKLSDLITTYHREKMTDKDGAESESVEVRF